MCELSTPINLSAPTVYFGKVQFLRMEHGYIRTKVKINGVRDITFYYDSIPEELKSTLTLGTKVSFTVKEDGAGKFCAENIEIVSEPSEASLPSVASSLSLSSLDALTSDDEIREGCIPSRKSSFSGVPRTPASMQLCFSQLQKPVVSSFSQNVDDYLQRVLTGNYNHRTASCWLL